MRFFDPRSDDPESALTFDKMPPDEFKRRREILGLSRKQMASVLGVSTETVYSWEHGRRNITNPTAILMRRLHVCCECHHVCDDCEAMPPYGYVCEGCRHRFFERRFTRETTDSQL